VTVPNRSEILGWTSRIPYTSHHKHISTERLDGTGEWLLKKNEYRKWRDSSASKLLLLRGIRKLPLFYQSLIPASDFHTRSVRGFQVTGERPRAGVLCALVHLDFAKSEGYVVGQRDLDKRRGRLRLFVAVEESLF